MWVVLESEYGFWFVLENESGLVLESESGFWFVLESECVWFGARKRVCFWFVCGFCADVPCQGAKSECPFPLPTKNERGGAWNCYA